MLVAYALKMINVMAANQMIAMIRIGVKTENVHFQKVLNIAINVKKTVIKAY